MPAASIIAPSIVSCDHAHLPEEITALESGGADWIHVDVMDGHFVPNITMGPFLVATYKRLTQLPLDVHLMIEQPERYLEAFARAGAAHLTVHVETCPHLYGTVQQIKALGCKAGVTLNPGTPLEALESVLPLADLVLVMSVNPGFSNQSFLPEAVGRVREMRRKLNAIRSAAWLEVDGGVNSQNLVQLKDAGATAFVSAHAIFTHPQGTLAGMKALREVADKSLGGRTHQV